MEIDIENIKSNPTLVGTKAKEPVLKDVIFQKDILLQGDWVGYIADVRECEFLTGVELYLKDNIKDTSGSLFALNQTNFNTLYSKLGNDYEKWLGKKIKLSGVRFEGKPERNMSPGIRTTLTLIE